MKFTSQAAEMKMLLVIFLIYLAMVSLFYFVTNMEYIVEKTFFRKTVSEDCKRAALSLPHFYK